MIRNVFYLFFASFLLILFISCSSTEKVETPKQNNAVQPEKKVEEKKIEEKVETKEVKTEEKKQESANNQNIPDAVYTKTFSDIEIFIKKINKIISDSNFDEWKKYLTQNYINYYSNIENLKTVSETPTLKKYKIVLRSLKDYFNYVVVPSRSEAKLDSISFVDDNNIKAYTIIDEEPIILYHLVKIDNNWKVEK